MKNFEVHVRKNQGYLWRFVSRYVDIKGDPGKGCERKEMVSIVLERYTYDYRVLVEMRKML